MDNNLQDQIDNIISVLSTKIRDRGTGHIHTAIRVLEQLKEEYQNEDI
jgi:hypothetical protein